MVKVRARLEPRSKAGHVGGPKELLRVKGPARVATKTSISKDNARGCMVWCVQRTAYDISLATVPNLEHQSIGSCRSTLSIWMKPNHLCAMRSN